MALYNPKSTLQLIIYGFAFVSLPLIFSLGYATIYVDGLAKQSQHAIYEAAQAIQNSRRLIEQVTAMERNTRQYLILKDKSLFQAYQENHVQFQKTAHTLYELALVKPYHAQIIRFIAAENDLFKRVSNSIPPNNDNRKIPMAFVTLTDMAQAILSSSNQLIDREITIMQKSAAKAQHIFFWLAVILAPLTIVLVVTFTVLISRPIRQVDHAIRQLGDGKLDSAIEVSGPQDQQYLGRQLDWLRKRLKELESQKTRFLRHVSHELKTPLTALLEGVALLKDKVAGPLNKEQDEIVLILRTNATRLQRLIEDFLNLTLRTPNLVFTLVNMKTLIKSVVHDHKPAIMAKTLNLETDLEPVQITADEERMRTVVDNLLSNAIKFSPDAGHIQIALTKEEEHLVLDVIDSGPGIKYDDRERVFDAFYQGQIQKRGYIKGSGLGLSIVREYVNAHRGSIEVVEGQASGAHLRVRLPLYQTEEMT